MSFIHSMQSKSALHGPAMFMANSGFTLPGFPSMGAWVTYGLGSPSEDLPAFVVLPEIDCPSLAPCRSDPVFLWLPPLGRAVFCGLHWQQN
jgi:hypothetical protein